MAHFVYGENGALFFKRWLNILNVWILSTSKLLSSHPIVKDDSHPPPPKRKKYGNFVAESFQPRAPSYLLQNLPVIG